MERGASLYSPGGTPLRFEAQRLNMESVAPPAASNRRYYSRRGAVITESEPSARSRRISAVAWNATN